MLTPAWSTLQLAEFVAAVAAVDDEAAAARTTVERAAEALDTDVAAIVCGGVALAAVGYPEGAAPIAELEAVTPGARAVLDVPGIGACAAAVAALEHPPGAALVVARAAPLTREENAVLRGIARVASLAMRLLRVVDEERAARAELRTVAGEQAALRRVATLVARGEPPAALFAAVAEEAGRVFGAADVAAVGRYDAEGAIEFVGGWTRDGDAGFVGTRVQLGGHNVSTLVFERNEGARVDRLVDDGTPTTARARRWVRSAAGAPINVDGRLWGAMIVGSERPDGLPARVEHELASFTELVATAIANAQAKAELTASRARIAATADETRRRIERDIHGGAQQRLISLVLRLRGVRATVPPDLEKLAADLDGLEADLTSALDELRDFAGGIHPAILAQGGLAAALNSLAQGAAVPVELAVRADQRLPEPIEVGAYYVVSEALTNVARHAGASRAAVEVEAGGGVLRVSVRDDGVGGADFAHGSGLVGLKDRVEALGGRLSLHSPRGQGTRVEVELPLTTDAAAARG